MKYNYDLLVIGSGSAGFSAAEAARGTGRKIGIVEAAELGGECPNWACVPTKVLLRSAKALKASQELGQYGVSMSGTPKLDFKKVMARRAKIVGGLGGKRMEKVASKLGLDVIRGHATFIDKNTVHVAGKEITAARFVIATGTKTRVPNIPGLDEVRWLSFKDAVMLESAPDSMIVIGGGPVGCELATFYASVGTKVTLLQAAPKVLHREEPEVSDIAREGLESLGVEVLTDVEVVRVHEEGKKQVTVRVGRKLETFSASEILLATGKTANTGGLGCKAAGVNLDQYGTVKVNKELRTTTPHIWAAGDVSGGMQFTHTAHYEGNIAGHNAFSKKALKVDTRVVPRVTFVIPEVGSVGDTEAQAKEKVGAVLVGLFDMKALGRGYVDGHREGLVKIIADKKTHRVLGGHVIGHHAGEIVHEIALAMYSKLKIDDLASMIHAYPTYSEAVTAAAAMALSSE